MKEIEVSAGEHINSAAERMIAALTEVPRVKCRFNDIVLIADRRSTVQSIVADFYEKLEERSRRWKQSPEGKRQAQEAMRERRELQIKADALMGQLPYLDFSDVAVLLDWLCEMEEPRDRIGVVVNTHRMITVFAVNGYVPNVNCGPDFKEDDPDNSARWLIGQALSSPYVPMVRHFTEQWKKKFQPVEEVA